MNNEYYNVDTKGKKGHLSYEAQCRSQRRKYKLKQQVQCDLTGSE
jgi:hypothetical protein